MIYRKLKISEYPIYESLLLNAKDKYIFQSTYYLKSLKHLGYDFEIFGAFEEDQLIAAIPIQKKKVLGIPIFFATPYGLVSSIDLDHSIELCFLNMIKKRSFLLKYASQHDLFQKKLKPVGYQETIMIDLSQDMDDVFSQFSKSNRSSIRRAIKDDAKVIISKDMKFKDLFLSYYQEMTHRKHIESISIKFLNDVLTSLIEQSLGFFALGSYQGEIYNIVFITQLNDQARYLYGASLETDLALPAIGQLIQFEVMQYLKTQQVTTYDLGGIPNTPVDENHPSYNVYKFKKGFGGEIKVVSKDYLYSKISGLSKRIK